MSALYKRGREAGINANLTPMIDVTFLLIVFFVLVSQIVEVESVEMDLPEPEDAVAVRPEEEQRAVINVVPRPGSGGEVNGYKLGARTYPPTVEGVDALVAQLAGLFESNPELTINLRADRATQYEFVEPAMQAITLAAARTGSPDITPRVNLVVVDKDGS